MPQRTGNSGGAGTSVVDFNEARESKLEEKRRKTERIFFRQLLSVYTVVSDHKMRPIDLIDVSEDGCSFQIPFDKEDVWPKDLAELPLRLYFSQDTYLEARMKIQNARPCIENGARFMRYGCTVDKNISSYPAYQQFVRFLKMYAEHAHKDLGDVSIFYL